MAGCTVQTGQNWSACFGLAQPLGLVAHLDEVGEGARPQRRWWRPGQISATPGDEV
jgi:hypothetical protein